MARRAGGAALALALLASGSPAWAQMQGPPRDYTGVFGGAQKAPSESRHQLTLDLSALGGYDDDVSGASTSTPGDPRFTESSSIGEASAQLNYRYGRVQRYVRFTLDGSATSYSALDYDVQASGTGSVEAFAEVGRRATLRGLHRTGYRNYFVIGSFTGLAPSLQPDIIPGSSAPFALGRRRAWTNESSADLTRRWGRSQETMLHGGWQQAAYTDSDLGGLTTLDGRVRHSFALSRQTSLSGSYGYTTADYERDDGSTRNVKSQILEIGLRAERRISPRRRMILEFGAGGTSIDTVREPERTALTYWTASGHGSVGIDLGRSWGVRGAYRRGWDYQEGFRDPLLMDSVALSVGGFLGRRLDTVFAAGYAKGQVGFSDRNGYESYTGSVQMRVALSRNAALFTNYVYYFYRFDDTADLTAGIPAEFDRQSVRVGVSLWVPLAGLFQRSGER